MPDDLRDRLVATGVELLTAEGTEALTLREIARRAGVSHGAPRRYFPTHRELLAAVARVGYDRLPPGSRPSASSPIPAPGCSPSAGSIWTSRAPTAACSS